VVSIANVKIKTNVSWVLKREACFVLTHIISLADLQQDILK
jgi:hypothetical protein